MYVQNHAIRAPNPNRLWATNLIIRRYFYPITFWSSLNPSSYRVCRCCLRYCAQTRRCSSKFPARCTYLSLGARYIYKRPATSGFLVSASKDRWRKSAERGGLKNICYNYFNNAPPPPISPFGDFESHRRVGVLKPIISPDQFRVTHMNRVKRIFRYVVGH